jgi:hypothetical protein
MARKDWKRYFAVIVESLTTGEVRRLGPIWKDRKDALTLVRSVRADRFNRFKPIGVGRIYGRTAKVQQELWKLTNEQ